MPDNLKSLRAELSERQRLNSKLSALIEKMGAFPEVGQVNVIRYENDKTTAILENCDAMLRAKGG
jgi:hypothetical protein